MLVATTMNSFLPGKQFGHEKHWTYLSLRRFSIRERSVWQSATAKRQMQYYIERENNIETPDQMYDATCKVTALSGFTANVLDIAEKKLYPKTKKIQNISTIQQWGMIKVKLKLSFMYGNTVVSVLEKNWCTSWTKCTKILRKGKILWWWKEIWFCVWKEKESCFVIRWSPM